MKKKLFMITLAVCLIVLSIASTSLAYFTDTDTKGSTFVAGNVKIALDLINLENTKLFPGQKYDQNATISNIGSEDAYVGAIITLENTAGLDSIITPNGDDTDNIPVAITKLITNLGGDGYEVKCVLNDEKTCCTVYVVCKNPLKGNQTPSAATTIFSGIEIPKEWDHDQMATFQNVEMTVTAYATQTVGFTSAEAALKAAFGSAEGDAWYDYPTT